MTEKEKKILEELDTATQDVEVPDSLLPEQIYRKIQETETVKKTSVRKRGKRILTRAVLPLAACLALVLVAVQVMANDTAIGICASQGNFELNVYMPVCIYNYLQSVRLLADALDSFRANCVSGIRANREKMDENLHRSLMLVTALNPYIGYENAAKTAKKAYHENISLKEACVALEFLTAEQFDEVFHPEQMV